PLLAYQSKKKLDAGLRLPRMAFYAEAIVLQVALLLLGIFVARREDIVLFRPAADGYGTVVISIAVLALALALMLVFVRFSGPKTLERLAMLVPGTQREQFVWVAVSAAAAMGEEVVYRGVMVTLLERSLGSWWIAVAISASAFGLAHIVQGWKNVAFIVVFAVVFHLLVRSTGSLAPAVVVHFLYDVITGFILGKRLAPRPDEQSSNEPDM
ncbi:MAG TPA: CPBP family intramembrane glutamic endopeptidase, partial [Thermoanaerobaculia bacterium]|nr:CPBP family intramembrane glutamic endopeptidase [Thermoanaerobaculia bacterium]